MSGGSGSQANRPPLRDARCLPGQFVLVRFPVIVVQTRALIGLPVPCQSPGVGGRCRWEWQAGLSIPGTRVRRKSDTQTRADVEQLKRAGAYAILVGESLMRSGNIAGRIRTLLDLRELGASQQKRRSGECCAFWLKSEISGDGSKGLRTVPAQGG